MKASQRPSGDQAGATAPAGAATVCSVADSLAADPSRTYSRPDDTNASLPWPANAAAPIDGSRPGRCAGPPARPPTALPGHFSGDGTACAVRGGGELQAASASPAITAMAASDLPIPLRRVMWVDLRCGEADAQ